MLNAGDSGGHKVKSLESKHRPYVLFDLSMVSFDPVIPVTARQHSELSWHFGSHLHVHPVFSAHPLQQYVCPLLLCPRPPFSFHCCFFIPHLGHVCSAITRSSQDTA